MSQEGQPRVVFSINAKAAVRVLLVVCALLGLLSVGLALRPAVTVPQQPLTATNYATQTLTLLQTATVTSISVNTITQTATSNQANPPGYSAYGVQVNCGYPFNPYYCNEGPPITVTGYLTNDTQCVNLYTGGETYVVWNLPQTYPDGVYQVYGFVYPNWPLTQPFPPYPFTTTLCVGVPVWAVAPYIQAGS